MENPHRFACTVGIIFRAAYTEIFYSHNLDSQDSALEAFFSYDFQKYIGKPCLETTDSVGRCGFSAPYVFLASRSLVTVFSSIVRLDSKSA